MSEEFLKNAKRTISKNNEISETNVEDDFCKYAKIKNCLAIKLVLLNLKGFPDRTVLCPGGRVFFIEFKKPKKKKTLSSLQDKWKKTLEDFGFIYYTCNNLQDAKNKLDAFLQENI